MQSKTLELLDFLPFSWQQELNKLRDLIFRQALSILKWRELLEVLHYIFDPSDGIADLRVARIVDTPA